MLERREAVERETGTSAAKGKTCTAADKRRGRVKPSFSFLTFSINNRRERGRGDWKLEKRGSMALHSSLVRWGPGQGVI